jgi:HSP20 family molecular chaperone IbpA
MVGLALKPEGFRYNRYTSEEPQGSIADGVRWRFAARPHIWRPPTDVYEIEEVVVIRVEVAGMREEDFSVSLVDRLVTVRGARPDTSERRAYHQMEIPFGEFSTEIDLPCQVAADRIEAVYRDGFLRIVLPKVRPQQVRVENADL